MRSAALFRLRHLLGIAVAVEKARLAGVLAARDACRRRAGEIRARIAAPVIAPVPAAAELAAAARWCLVLSERLRAAERRAAELEQEAEAIRGVLARVSGREAAVAGMAERARRAAQRLEERRAEAAMPPRWRRAQSSPSGSAGPSAGSPGIA